jgi:hypothetical protein
MLQVVRGFVCSDTVALTKWMAGQAKAGKLRGVAVCFRLEDADEEFVFTGPYKSRPVNAITAAARMYWKASKQAEPNGGTKR